MIRAARSSSGFGIFVVAITAFAFAACSGSSDGASGSDDDAGSAAESGSDAPKDDGAAAARDGATIDAGPTFAAIDLPLTGCPQAGFAANFTVGNEQFDLVVDTGSAELGVAGSACSNCAGVAPRYTPTAGATNENATTSVSYVSGTGWSGDIFSDAFGVASHALSAPTRLVAIESESGGFFDASSCGLGTVPFTFEGIAGFAPASLATSGTDEPMAALAKAGLPDIFAVALCGIGGHLWLGGFDATAATAPPQYTPLIAGDYYAITVDDLKIGGSALGFSANAIHDVVVDTDTTELELPSAVYTAARNAIGANASFQGYFGGTSFFSNGSCIEATGSPSVSAVDAALPSFTIAIADGAGGTHDVTLSATQSYLEPIVKNGITYYCPEIEPLLGSSTVLGSAFLRSEITIYDRAAKRIGFAPYAGCATR